MDDNRLLTLPNGERIRLQPHCAMICETFDLQYASPATISRCGMVWVDPKNLGYRPFYERWVRKRCGNGRDIAPDKEEEAGHLEALFDQYVTKCIDYVQFGLVDGELGAKLRSVIPITSIDMIKQLTTALDAFLGPLYEHMPPETLPERDDIENVYAFCVNWSIGAALLGSSMELFNAFVKKIATCGLPDGLIADNVFDPESKRWEKWSARRGVRRAVALRFYEIIVPATDSTKFSHLLQEMAPRKPILFVGASGTAKTTIINDYLGSLDDEVSATHASASRAAVLKDVQANIEANVDKRTGNFYGPPVGKKLTIFIDDMNMPKVDTYGTQQPITLLLTLISRGFIYDREKDLTQKILKDLCYIGAMGPPGGGRNKVDTRFVALFSVFNLPDPAQEVLTHMYSAIISQNLRDFAPNVKDVGAKFPEAMLKLFAFIRIFCDRLVSEADLTLVEGKVSELIGEAFPECKDEALENPLVFGDYKHAVRRLTEEAEDPRLYCDMGSLEGTRKIFDAVMENYNMDNSPMTLVLFEQALEHLTRVHRIIRLPRGNALLIGVGGSGKQSLTRLAAYCAGYDIFNISLVRNYGEDEFRADLKTLYTKLGEKEVVFLFTDAHVAQEGFLEFLNNMLTTGMVPALYEQDERDQLCNSVRKQVKELGIIDTPDNLWKYYVSKCQNNLHIVLAMSPSGDKLRLRCRSFPGLISNAVIDWFFPWPEDALSKVANYFLAEVPLPAENREAIVQHLATRFATVLRRYYYVTPKNYLDYIQNYQSQLSLNEKKVDSSVKRLSGGLSKLVDAAKDVDRMSIELTDAKVIVDAKTTDVEALITQIQEKTKIANEQKAEATIKQEQASEQAVDIAEIKNFAKPPKLVQDVCLMVVCLRPTGEKLDETWADAKKMLSNSQLLDKLKKYPKARGPRSDNITEKMMKSVRKYFKDPNMTVEKMESISKAGKGLLVWVVAISKYYDVAKNVEPLKAKVREMEKGQAKTERELAELNVMLSSLEKELNEFNAQYTEKNEELTGLQTQARAAARFTHDFRTVMIYETFVKRIADLKVPVTETFQLESFLSSDAIIQGWTAKGLPADEHSIQNGILTTAASRFPLCIDPQQQAVGWIKAMYSKSQLKVKTLSEADFMKHLELAIQFGTPFLFENVDEELDPMLDPILEKNTFVESGQKLIQLGDKNPEVMSKTMIINYSVTGDGLANQLLNVVVAHERPDLESQYAELVSQMSESFDDRAERLHARRAGSILYFVMASLSTINAMYETSLDSFLGVFNGALDNAKRDVVLDSRLKNMMESVMREIYDYTCTGIFERHKLMFAFQMTCQVQDGDGNLVRPELDAFLKGDTGLDAPKRPSPVPWLGAASWKDLLALCAMGDHFDALRRDFEAHTDTWKAWYDLEAPESVDFPDGHSDGLTPLQKLCVMRVFRADRVYNAVKLYVIASIGEKYVQPPVLDYGRIFAQSNERSPMVFILSPGADPQSDIQLLCDEKGFTSKFRFIALGQGQAEELIDQGTAKGHWVLLQNCHLLVSWLKKLEKRLELMKAPHKDFRLWLTTEPSNKFPLGILQRSLKVVTEPPDGLKLNMRATFSKIDQTVLDECPHPAFRPCLFVLAWLHAVVQERRKYGKIGWNVNYDFNESDFQISRKLLSLYLKKAFEDEDEFLPWGSLKYLIGDAMYGGACRTTWTGALSTYLTEYMGDFLFDECQKFFFSQAGYDFDLPETGPLENYTEHIERLPLTNSPAVFGLHPNAKIGFYSNATKSMWRDLISLQPRSASAGGGLSRDEIISNAAKDIQSKVPLESLDIGSYDTMIVRSTLYERNGTQTPTPCQVVLLQELERWNLLVIKMAVTLSDLQRVQGEIGMSDELDSLGVSLFNGFIPDGWKKLMPNTQKPLGSWMVHFIERYAQYDKWIKVGEPAVIWLSGLGIPESYLTALVQTTCRMLNWPLDKSTMSTKVTSFVDVKEVPGALDSGTYVRGLYLEGAAWDHEHSCLKRQDPKVLVVELPILQVIPIEASKVKTHGVFITPVYVTQDRRNAMGVGLVFEANLDSEQHTSHWVLQGVSLSLNTDEARREARGDGCGRVGDDAA
ncbi:dynein light chain binding protein [Aureococcus anophagefferens]|nr:dynein light chain binding protein [Aureococcus anophagefferens]